jgi:hypothetical protein
MSIPNENLSNVNHKRTIADAPTFGNGISADSPAGGEVRRERYSPVYDEKAPAGVAPRTPQS